MTRDQAIAAHYRAELHFTGNHECTRTVGPRGGVTENVTRVRVSGACKVWKRELTAFRLPVKYGLYESSAVEAHNSHLFHVPSECPLEVQS